MSLSSTSVLGRIVAVEGNIGAGKTTLVKRLAHVASHVLHEPVVSNPYLTRFYQDPHKWALRTQLWLLKQRFRTYRSAVELLQTPVAESAPLIVIDRSVWSDWVFARQAYADGFISSADFDWYMRLRARIAERLPLQRCPFAVVYLDVTPKECHHRVHNVRRRPFESGISLEYLQGLDHFYGEFLTEMTQRGAPVLRFDWNAYGNVETVIDAVKKLR